MKSKFFKRTISLILCAAICFGNVLPANATETSGESISVSEEEIQEEISTEEAHELFEEALPESTGEECTVYIENFEGVTAEASSKYSEESGQELWTKYVDQQMRDFGFSSYYGDYGDSQNFMNYQRQIYNEWLESVSNIAAYGGSTVIEVTLDSPLPITGIAQTGLGYQVKEAIELSRLYKCLLVDCPYELYWHDKTVGVSMNCTYRAYDDDIAEVLKITFKFAVAKEFIPSDDTTSGYTVKKPNVSTDDIKKAQENALEVVYANEDLGDFDKLVAYKNYICNAVDYNHTAADEGFEKYGSMNPWQLIWVFDNKPSTQVVCEGYAKAFQYLCELSEFQDEYFESYIITGTTSRYGSYEQGGHMWNQVTLNDINYLVDITNADGNPTYSNVFFMNSDTGDSDGDGFGIPFSSSYVIYLYDTNTKNIYPEEILVHGKRTHNYDSDGECTVCGREKPLPNQTHDGVTFIPWKSSTSLPTTAGNYYLAKDVKISSSWSPSANIKLCLNGHSITKTTSGYAFSISGVTVDIYDCTSNPGSITHSSGVSGNGVYISNGIFNLHNGKITGHTGIGVENAGTFNMYGGSVSGNTSVYSTSSSGNCNGGGVQNTGIFNMSGGTITGNTSKKLDGGGVWNSGTFNMTGGSITGNAAVNGGGVWNEGILNISNGSVTGNSATTNYGGIYNGGTMTFNNKVTVSNNKVGTVASNLYLAEGKTVTIGESGLNSSSSIGITTATAPVYGAPVAITSNSASSYKNFFFSENTECYQIGTSADGKIVLETVPHYHSWSTEWVGGGEAHWHECTEKYCYITDNTQKEGYAAHNFSEDGSGFCTACESIPISESHFPDNNFRTYISETFDKNGNNLLSKTEVAAITSINCVQKEISNLKGIELFPGITSLSCSYNNLTELDLIDCPTLKKVYCYGNQIASINISNCPNLEILNCSSNKLTELDISKNITLTTLDCSKNQLTELDISENISLTTLNCDENLITELDLSKNTELDSLYCRYNQLTTLDVSNIYLDNVYCDYNQISELKVNGGIEKLYCSNNQLTELDLNTNSFLAELCCSNNKLTKLALGIDNGYAAYWKPDLVYINCENNQLTELNLSRVTALTKLDCSGNKLASLDLSKNTALETVDLSNNNAPIVVLKDYTSDLSALPGFDVSKASDWTNATVSENILTVTDINKKITYTYDCNNGLSATFTLVPQMITIAIDATNFPDENFREYVKRFDTDGSGRLSTEEIDAVTSIDCSDNSITSLKGVEHFLELKILKCNNCRLSNLDVSQNTALETLYCDGNYFTNLDVSKNSMLETLSCNNTRLISLDLSSNAALKTLYCNNTWLTSLDVSKNTALTSLNCDYNQFTSLDVSSNMALEALSCNNNKLTNLDVSKNAVLEILSCNNNKLTNLDLSQNAALTSLSCNSNQLAYLNVSKNTVLTSLSCSGNQLTSLNLSEDIVLTVFDCSNNSASVPILSNNTFSLGNLSGFDASKASNWTNANVNGNILTVTNTAKNVTYKYSSNDNYSITFTLKIVGEVFINAINFPDANFREYVKKFDTNKDGKLSSGELYAVKEINCSQKSTAVDSSIKISSIKGIEYFTEITELYCYYNKITELDVSKNTKLTELRFEYNKVKEINLKNNQELVGLYCYNNNLTELDLSANTKLESLACGSNQIKTLYTSNNIYLRTLSCENNQLELLNVSKSPYLEYIYCNKNSLTELDISNNPLLHYLSCSDNLLTFIDLSKNPKIGTFYADRNRLTSMDLTPTIAKANAHMLSNEIKVYVDEEFKFYLNELPGKFDVSKASNWSNATISGNTVTVTDVNFTIRYLYDCGNGVNTTFTIIPKMTVVVINATNFPDANFREYVKQFDTDGNGKLSMEERDAVTSIDCSSKNIKSLEGVEHFTELKILKCDNNKLTNLDISENKELEFLSCSNNRLTSLGVSQHTKLEYLYCNNNQLIALNVKENTNLTILECSNNSRSISLLSNNTFDLGSGFSVSLASNWVNASIEGRIITVSDLTQNVTYTYDCGNGNFVTFTLVPTKVEVEINETNFPDAIFREYVTQFDTDSDGILFLEEVKPVTEIYCSNMNITSLKGVEYFTNLKTLSCNYNQLTELYLNQNTELKYLYCYGNKLTKLDVSQSAKLYYLDCNNNQLTELNIDGAMELKTVKCYSNKLTEFVVGKNIVLTDLDCSRNSLANLDVSQSAALYNLDCYDNQLAVLDTSKNAKLYRLNCSNNQLTELDTSKNTELYDLDCHNNQLAVLDISKNAKLYRLDCHNNQLTELDTIQNIALSTLSCCDNQIIKLDVSKNTNLSYFYCYNNQLAEIDVSQNTGLVYFYCYNNQLTEIDVSQNVKLYDFNCNSNRLKKLDISKNTELYYLRCSNNKLTSLDTSNNINLKTLSCNNNTLPIVVSWDKKFNLEELEQYGFDSSKASSWSNVSKIEGKIITLASTFSSNVVKCTYTYNTGLYSVEFSIYTHSHTSEKDDGDCTTPVICSKCDNVITEERASHTGGTATCTKKAKCEVCQKEYGELLPHTLTKVNAVVQVHTTDKLTPAVEEHYKCSTCGKLFTDAESNTETTIEIITGETPTHTFNVKNSCEEALKSSATFDKDAEYYFSCSCGKVGHTSFYYIENSALGATVCGCVESFGENVDITVELYKNGASEAAYSIIITAEETEKKYSFSGVKAGDYILKISKERHAHLSVAIAVTSQTVTRDVKIYLFGDLSGDGKITVRDAMLIYDYANNELSFSPEQLGVADVDKSGTVDKKDAEKIYDYCNGIIVNFA